jgi:integrase
MADKLSEETVKALAAPETGNRVTYFAGHKLQGLKAPPGFGVRVTAGGAKAFVLNYRIGGRERRYTIGAFPTWPVIRALKVARELRQQIDDGHDPQEAKEAARAPEIAGKTVTNVLDEFTARYLKRKEKPLRTAGQIERVFERLVKPAIGDTGIYDLRRSHVVEMLDGIEDENGPVMADRTLAYCRKAFNWHAARDDQFSIPIVRGMARTQPKDRARRRILADDEIRDLWGALDLIERPACYPRYIRALLLTAQRRDEVAKMSWPEIDEDIWIIPAERYKTGIECAVPLSAMARQIIGSKAAPREDKAGRMIEPGPFVFSTTEGREAFCGYSKSKRDLDAKLTEFRARDGRDPMPHWTLHDLRRTARSLMSRAGVPSDIAERVLGHVIPGVRAVYDRHSFSAEKRDALDRLAAMVRTILEPPAANVANLGDHRRARGEAVAP